MVSSPSTAVCCYCLLDQSENPTSPRICLMLTCTPMLTCQVQYDPASGGIVSCSYDKTVRLWSVGSRGTEVHTGS